MNLLEEIDFKSNTIKDFNQAYRILESKLIEIGSSNSKTQLKSNLLITERSLDRFLKDKNKQVESNESKEEIHNRLYNEKDRYFEQKRFVNKSKDEVELSRCTFKPNTDKRPNQSSMSRDNLSQKAKDSDNGSVQVTSLQLNRSFDKFYQD